MNDESSDVGPDEYPETSTTGFALAPGDVDIFKVIHEFRFLRREHISAVTGRPAKRLHRRLFKLAGNGYVSSIRLPQQKHIYGLGKAALPILVEHGVADTELLTQRLRTHELKELFLKHEMMIVELHVILWLATRVGPITLVDWREGKALYDSVSVSDRDGRATLPVRPDAFFTLEDSRRPAGANRAHFFLEADRSTETQSRFRDKIRGYWHYMEQGLHAKKFGIKNFRVLTVTLTHERAENLCLLANTASPERAHKHFFFTSLKNFSLENSAAILDSIYLSARTPGSTTRYSLIPAPSATKADESTG